MIGWAGSDHLTTALHVGEGEGEIEGGGGGREGGREGNWSRGYIIYTYIHRHCLSII